MKKNIFITMILFGVSVAYSQQDCFDKIAKQAVEIDSLEKIIRSRNDSIREYIRIRGETSKSSNDTIKQLRSDLSKLKKFIKEKETFDAQFKHQNDSIALLKNQISIKEGQIAEIKQLAVQKAIQEKENGKREALTSIVNTYKGKKFDDLIKSSGIESVQRDKQLVENTEVKQTLGDLEKYFNAEELFSKKFDINAVKNAQNQVSQINQQSELVKQPER
ncbi:MAG: hypothetical protein IPK21_21040 [Haliscomenobacter sp.]|nr:hypothetical protein [Haliscomenobacter sp.]